MTARSWKIAIPLASAPLASNRRVHWSRRHREHAYLRSEAQIAVWKALAPAYGSPHDARLEAIDLVVRLHPPDRRRRDSDNYVAHVLKPIKDGVRDALDLPDDTDRYISWRLELAPEPSRTDDIFGVRWLVELEITERSSVR